MGIIPLLKHPLMNCSRIQLSPSSLYPPSLSFSNKPFAHHQCAQLCVHVFVYACAKEVHRDGALMSKSDGDCYCCNLLFPRYCYGLDVLRYVYAPF